MWPSTLADSAASVAGAVPVSETDAVKDQTPEQSICGTAEEGSSVDDIESSQASSSEQSTTRLRYRRIIQGTIFSNVILALIAGTIVALLLGMGVINSSDGGSQPTQGGQDNDKNTNGGYTNTSWFPPTFSPTLTPTSNPTASPTSAPVLAPTSSPTIDNLLKTLTSVSGSRLNDPNSPQWRAYQWMKDEDTIIATEKDEDRIKQRYALITLYLSLSDEIPPYASYDECDWPTIECSPHTDAALQVTEIRKATWQLTELRLARQSFTGVIPPEIALLAPSLIHLDLAENELHGGIPDELYNLVNLKYLYLHNNALTGSLSEDIEKLQLLEEFFIGNNRLEGTIPLGLGPTQGNVRPLQSLSLHNNKLTGTIPDGLNLWFGSYIDLSYNKLSGPLPTDIGGDYSSLRHLYLDHNALVGPIPESYTAAGNNGLTELYLNDNKLTGAVPSWDKDALISTLMVQNNNLTTPLDRNLCKLSIFNKGKLVDLGADCAICQCDDLCDKCY